MKKVKIFYNEYIKEDSHLKDIKNYLKEKTVLVDDIMESDFVITFGGDGTILRASKELIKKDVPLLAINKGSLGFLADVKLEEAIVMIDKVIKNDFESEKRNLLEIYYNDNVFFALNDVVIAKGGLISKLVNIEVSSNDKLLNIYRGDGVIISTPSGSTAYSLSAGGPIVHPSLEAFVITPLSPHTLSNRPIVIDKNNILSFKVSSRCEDIHLNIDGSNHFKIDKNDKIKVTLSEKFIRLIIPENRDYYAVLREKLKWGEPLVKG